jgi:hypothetical protein
VGALTIVPADAKIEATRAINQGLRRNGKDWTLPKLSLWIR